MPQPPNLRHDDADDVSARERLARIEVRLTHIDKELGELVTRVEFNPVKAAVYGIISLLVTSVLAAMIALVIQKGTQ